VGLLFQVRQAFLHGLDLEPEFRQIRFQHLDLLGPGLVAALEAVAAFAAITAAITAVFTVTILILAITGFVRHFLFLSQKF
jgi:hypothetical protein